MIVVLPGAIVLAFVITLVEMTEVAILVLALGAEEQALRRAASGAAGGVAVVAVAAVFVGSAIGRIPSADLLGASAVILAAFGVFLFQSTLGTFRKLRRPSGSAPAHHAPIVHFAGGFTVGVVEATETVLVLIPLAAAGEASAAVIGALAAGIVLAVAVLLVHERIRRVNPPWLKLGATALIFTYAVFWGGEALGVSWPLSDLFLIPLFVAGVIIVRGGLELLLRRAPTTSPSPT